VCHIFLRKNRAYRKSDDPYNLPKVFNRDARARILYTVSDKEFKELHHWSLVGIYCAFLDRDSSDSKHFCCRLPGVCFLWPRARSYSYFVYSSSNKFELPLPVQCPCVFAS
jgi:hypothetical protein